MKKRSIIGGVSLLLLGGLAVLAVKAQNGDFDELIEKDGLEGLDIDGDIVDSKSKEEVDDFDDIYKSDDFDIEIIEDVNEVES